MQQPLHTENPENRIIVILGMHRSGTSLITKSLETLGIDLHLKLDAAPDNPAGFWEDADVKAINERLLKQLNARWDSVRELPLELLQTEFVQEIFNDAVSLVKDRVTKIKLWGFKDPRVSRLLPFWQKVFVELNITPNYVLIVRHPSSVASSLKTRNNFTEDQSYLLWLRYTLDAIKYLREQPFHLALYERFMSSPELEIESLSHYLKLEVNKPKLTAFKESVFDKSLQHSTHTLEEENSAQTLAWKNALKIYEIFSNSSENEQKNLQERFSETADNFALISELCSFQDALTFAYSQFQDSKGYEEQILKLTSSHAQLHEDYKEAIKDLVDSHLESNTKYQNETNRLIESNTKYQNETSRLLQQYESVSDDYFESQRSIVALELANQALILKEEELLQQNENLNAQNENLNAQIESDVELKSQLEQSNSALIRDQDRMIAKIETLNQTLNRERFTVFKPIVRTLYSQAGKTLLRLPHPIAQFARRVRQKVLPGGLTLHPQINQNYAKPSHSEQDLDLPELNQIKNAGAGNFDVMLFPVIDWQFRIQRPQHIVRELAKEGHRVIYLATTIYRSPKPSFKILDNPDTNIFVIQLGIPKPVKSIYHHAPSDQQATDMANALYKLERAAQLKCIVAIIDLPFWKKVVDNLPSSLTVYDCMDHHAGFENNSQDMLFEEQKLVEDADIVIASSANLHHELAEKRQDTALIRNAAEIDYFSREPEKLAWQKNRPVIGYYGAIAEWFDIDLVTKAAKNYPDYDFLMIGAVTNCDISEAERLDNVHFFGEVPYATLTQYLYSFDACLIPFKINQLTLCTNPVKVYEYLAAGKPVISTALPEVLLMEKHVLIAESDREFISHIDHALEVSNRNPALIAQRTEFAKSNDWSSRAKNLEALVNAKFPLLSVIVLTYNNLDFTKACLNSLYQFTRYPHWELIIVDNASSDDTPAYLEEFAAHHTNVQLILNEKNKGFAAGNNDGLRAAKGDFLIILNNDTYVTDGWSAKLVRHLQLDEHLGLVGPVTNNIGNEAKIDINYANMEEMHKNAREHTLARRASEIKVNNVAFFCVAMRRALYEKIGGLDEAFGQGFFEDDDYCNRVREQGFEVAIAEDVFVHHHLSASFNELGNEKKQALFEKNKAIYESKWGKWTPHEYRKEN